MSPLTLNEIINGSLELFKEKLDNSKDIIFELTRPLDAKYYEYSNLIEVICAYSSYPEDKYVLSENSIDNQKFEYLLKKITQVKNNEASKFLNEFICPTTEGTLYLQCAVSNNKIKMKLLCQYGYNPTETYQDLNSNQELTFKSVLSMIYSGNSLKKIIDYHKQLCSIYFSEHLEQKLPIKSFYQKIKI